MRTAREMLRTQDTYKDLSRPESCTEIGKALPSQKHTMMLRCALSTGKLWGQMRSSQEWEEGPASLEGRIGGSRALENKSRELGSPVCEDSGFSTSRKEPVPQWEKWMKEGPEDLVLEYGHEKAESPCLESEEEEEVPRRKRKEGSPVMGWAVSREGSILSGSVL